ncbi:DUF6247 family protein [Actinomadura harenae]|uniref:Uncharacterized protein n=1 Tax=Actinomadura harenae TaxID=2483351 RepID=A0A3M2ME18_9ACTN|nr:DUF6247 family protein [Actinomadura harenae]RMI45488.1 hypothetical protein EBO15_09775 [Actinomadura harenae]
MTAQPEDALVGEAGVPEKGLRDIRAALVTSQDRQAFDAGLKAVLDEVRVSLDPAPLNEFVHRWWISACDSVRDPQGRSHLHQRAAQIAASQAAPQGTPWRAVLSEREQSRENDQ